MDEILTTIEAAKLLKLSLTHFRRQVRQGRIPVRRYGKLWRFLRSELLHPPEADRSVTVQVTSGPQAFPQGKAKRTLRRESGILRFR